MPFGSFKGYKVRSNKYIPPKDKAKALISKVPLNPIQRRQVKKLVEQPMEHKHHTVDAVYTQMDFATVRQYLLTAVPQVAAIGNDQTREGDQITLKSIDVRLLLQNGINLTTSPPGTTWRIVIVQDKNYNSSGTINPLEVFNEDTNSTLAGWSSHRNVDHLGTKIILYDKTFVTSIYTNNDRMIHVKPNMKYCKKTIQYNAGSTTNQEGGIYILLMNNSNATIDPYFTFQSRITYTDA